MTPDHAKAHEEARIRARLDDWAKATRAKDIEGIVASYAPDILSFDCHSQLQLKGAEAHRKHLQASLPCMQGPMIFELHDLDVVAKGDVGFCHGLAWCGGTGASGEEHSGWLRVTVCLRKTNGEWMIVHGHCSAPFDPESGKALLELEPQDAGRTRAA